jgi:hypothetical protein
LATSLRVVMRSAPRSSRLLVDQGAKASPIVGVALDRNAVRPGLERGPQFASFLERARLDNDRAFRRRRAKQRRERGQEVAPLRGDPDDTAAAEHGYGVSLVGEASGLARDRLPIQADEPQRVWPVAKRRVDELSDALADQALVITVDEVEDRLAWRALEKLVCGAVIDDHARF